VIFLIYDNSLIPFRQSDALGFFFPPSTTDPRVSVVVCAYYRPLALLSLSPVLCNSFPNCWLWIGLDPFALSPTFFLSPGATCSLVRTRQRQYNFTKDFSAHQPFGNSFRTSLPPFDFAFRAFLFFSRLFCLPLNSFLFLLLSVTLVREI